jgi:hypothetical protein
MDHIAREGMDIELCPNFINRKELFGFLSVSWRLLACLTP